MLLVRLRLVRRNCFLSLQDLQDPWFLLPAAVWMSLLTAAGLASQQALYRPVRLGRLLPEQWFLLPAYPVPWKALSHPGLPLVFPLAPLSLPLLFPALLLFLPGCSLLRLFPALFQEGRSGPAPGLRRTHRRMIRRRNLPRKELPCPPHISLFLLRYGH